SPAVLAGSRPPLCRALTRPREACRGHASGISGERTGTMARTAKKTKAVTVAMAENTAADTEIRNAVEEAADVVVTLPMPDAASTAAEIASGTETEPAAETVTGRQVLIPLNKLKKSPRNARKTPHSDETVETYAASIAAKGILQNLVVEPELGTDGAPTGFYFVTIGEG